jgi:hypothetical protein
VFLLWTENVGGITENVSISRRVVIVREGFSKLEVLLGLPPLLFVDMFHVTSGGFGF